MRPPQARVGAASRRMARAAPVRATGNRRRIVHLRSMTGRGRSAGSLRFPRRRPRRVGGSLPARGADSAYHPGMGLYGKKERIADTPEAYVEGLTEPRRTDIGRLHARVREVAPSMAAS